MMWRKKMNKTGYWGLKSDYEKLEKKLEILKDAIKSALMGENDQIGMECILEDALEEVNNDK